MGVRYNAEKRKTGSYYSTPVFAFRCKCHLCAGWFEIQTDPKNTRYVVTEGARQQYPDPEPDEENGNPVFDTEKPEGEQGDAFAKFEKDTTSKKRAMTNAERMAELEDLNDDRWSDPYELNRALRKSFREDKGKRREKRDKDDELAARYGLGASVRLDLVRQEERRKEGEPEADWLSKADLREVANDKEDEEQWQVAQTKRRRIHEADEAKKASLKAETMWKETPRSQGSSSSSKSRTSSQVARKSKLSSNSSTVVSKLSSQLRMNTARKADPFGSIF